MTKPGTRSPEVVWRKFRYAQPFFAYSFTTCQTTFSVISVPQTTPMRQTHRKILPWYRRAISHGGAGVASSRVFPPSGKLSSTKRVCLVWGVGRPLRARKPPQASFHREQISFVDHAPRQAEVGGHSDKKSKTSSCRGMAYESRPCTEEQGPCPQHHAYLVQLGDEMGVHRN